MKKHLFAFICVFVIMFNTFSYTHTNAMDIGVAIDVGSEILYEGWDMIQSIFNGFIISLGQYAGYADKASAMAAFYNDWGDVLTVLTGGYLSPTEVEQPAIGVNTVMPRDFGMTGATMRDFIFNYGGFIADPNLGMYADINMKSLASWNRYNDLYAQRFLDAHNADIESHPTYPDVSFVPYINLINEKSGSGTDFFWKDDSYFPLYLHTEYTITAPASNYSYFTRSNYNNLISSANNTNSMYYCPITDVKIYNINGVYTINQSISYTSDIALPPLWGSPNSYSLGFAIQNGQFVNSAVSSSIVTNTFNFTYSSSVLSNVFQFLSDHCRNINIYVDDVLWAYVGHEQQQYVDLGIDHPRYDESGQMIGNDVFFPEQDLKADLVKFTELIDDKILTGDSIDLDDLIDAGVLTDAEGNIITDENRDEYIKTRDISSVITDALDDTDIADLLPDAPDPPIEDPWNWHFPTIVIPEGGDPDPRGTGLSVLARIVNVVNQSLPAEVITMFWGICITLLILGIIKILHK